jgi:hypothetical protein
MLVLQIKVQVIMFYITKIRITNVNSWCYAPCDLYSASDTTKGVKEQAH